MAISNGSTLTTTTSYDPDGNAITQTQQSQAGSGPVSTRVLTATVNAADWTTSSGDGPAPGTGTGPGTGTPLVTAYQYDGAGQPRSQSVLTTTLPVTSVLNGDGLATAIGESVGATPPYTSAFGYTANDLPLTATLPGGTGIAEQFGYDGANRLTTQTLSGPLTATNVLTSSYLYAYNPADWTTALTSVVSGITTTQVYTHDAEGRLIGRALPGVTQSWSDDGNGNVLTATTTTTTTLTTTNAYAAAQANQLLSSTTTGKPTVYFGYDQHGDTTSITNTAGLSVGLSYDAQERPITLTSGSATATLSYNAAGERAGYNVTVGSTPYYSAQFSYRGAELGQAVIVSGTQAYTDTYLYTPEGTPLELIRQSASGGTLTTSRYWYEEDGRGNVVALTDITGTVVDRYSYDAWGTLTSSSESVPQRLRYAGYWYDQEFGWYWVGVRYYDPPLGRWLQPDPSQQDGVHTYVYVDDDPVDESDPSGLQGVCTLPNPDISEACQAAAAAAAAAAAVGAAIGLVVRVGKEIITGTRTNRRSERRLLFHYTDQQGLQGIISSGVLLPSLGAAGRGRASYGTGQYFTDLPPTAPLSAVEYSYALYNSPRVTQKVQYWILIDVSGLDVQRVHDIYTDNLDPAALSTIAGYRFGIWLRPGTSDLPLRIPKNRIVAYGPTTFR